MIFAEAATMYVAIGIWRASRITPGFLGPHEELDFYRTSYIMDSEEITPPFILKNDEATHW